MANYGSPSNKIYSDTCRVEGCENPRKPAANGRGRHAICRTHLNERRRAAYAEKSRA